MGVSVLDSLSISAYKQLARAVAKWGLQSRASGCKVGILVVKRGARRGGLGGWGGGRGIFVLGFLF